ncbi:MAG: lactoylglutathione lyase [bacterium]
MTDPKPEFRIDHTMIRVRDLEQSLDFYTRILGMEVLRKADYPDGRFTNAFVGYRGTDAALELTHNWDQDAPYDRGDAWGHIALTVADVRAAGDYLKAAGVRFTKEPSPMKHGTRMIAFLLDPDGYSIELVEAPSPA